MNLLAQADPYVGKYFSQEFLRTKILRQTDGEMIEQDNLIKKEIADGTIPDPSTIDPITGEPLPAAEPGSAAGANATMDGAEAAINSEAGIVPTDPAPPSLPKKGEGQF